MGWAHLRISAHGLGRLWLDGRRWHRRPARDLIIAELVPALLVR